ncbi:MAG TPA: oxidoreductase [Sphingomonas sp.]|nr:oxidoreductase [Sphingomonas sp.]
MAGSRSSATGAERRDRHRTWLVTGCSSGLGRALAETLVARGERLIATARDPDQLKDLAAASDRVRALKLDVTSPEDIAAVAAAVAECGVDVLVNNAGYGFLAAFEEAGEADYRAQFETNLFGVIAVTRAILPGMRLRGSGHIVNIASVGGLVGNPGSAYYSASKFAVVGLSESLAKELSEFGIRVSVIEPGALRTDWAGRSLRSSARRVAAYRTVHERLREISRSSDQRSGDPARAARAIVAAVESENPPLHLVLGASGLERVRERIASFAAGLNEWELVSVGIDYGQEPSVETASPGQDMSGLVVTNQF